jgi:probable addiction module antidote protein
MNKRPYRNYEDSLVESLKDPQEAERYLNAALDEGDMETFLLALYHVAKAFGLSRLAEKAKIHRVSLHKMLSNRGNPEFASVLRLIDASGFQFLVKPKLKRAA